MISPTALAAAIWGAVGLLALVFLHLVRSLLRGNGVGSGASAEVDR